MSVDDFEHLIGIRVSKRPAGRRHDRLPTGRKAMEKQLAAPGIELRENVVEEQERRWRAARDQKVGLGEKQRQYRKPLFSLRPVDAKVASG